MFYPKKTKMIKPRRQKLVLSNFRGYDEDKITTNLPCDWTDSCLNFAFKNNKLVAGVGIEDLKVIDYTTKEHFIIPPLPITNKEYNVFLWRTSDITSNYTKIVLSHYKGFYSLELKKDAQWVDYELPIANYTGMQTDAINFLYEDKDLLLMSGGGQIGLLILEDDTIKAVNNALEITQLCAHYERVFAVVKGKRNSLWFSDSFDPYNWNVSIAEGGYIEFDGTLGQVNTIKSFKDYLYVFCDYGIYRLTAFADQSSFNLKRLYSACGKIYAESVAECGDKILFASSEGLYRFDGFDVSRINIGVKKLLINSGEKVEGIYCNNKYYLSIKCNNKMSPYAILDGASNDFNRLLTIDTLNYNVDISDGLGLYNMLMLTTPYQNSCIAICNDTKRIVIINNDGQAYENEPLRIWRIKSIDCGEPINQKVIRGIEYSSDIQFYLGVIADGQQTEFLLSPKENYKSLNIKGHKFEFFIKSTCRGGEISPPRITVDFLRS